MTAIVTYRQLIKADACRHQRKLFKDKFGDRVKITPELCQAFAQDFDWDWAAEHLLSASARADYKRATAPAWAAYETATATARAAYETAMRADYDRATVPARADYERATVSARADYKRATATAWASAYLIDKSENSNA